ncbi:DoxX family protein [Paenibacillaceae bacterium]|nr:DoxX family protein [Paenibacillaceae bacterium]
MKMNTIATIMRVSLGIIFLAHGIAKFQMGLSNVAGWFDSLGIPSFLGYVVAILEVVGGIALIVGLGTRIFSVGLIAIMLGAIIVVKLPVGLLGNADMGGFELDLALLVLLVYFVFGDDSGFGVDQLFGRRHNG